jgi:hypothetical protein
MCVRRISFDVHYCFIENRRKFENMVNMLTMGIKDGQIELFYVHMVEYYAAVKK